MTGVRQRFVLNCWGSGVHGQVGYKVLSEPMPSIIEIQIWGLWVSRPNDIKKPTSDPVGCVLCEVVFNPIGFIVSDQTRGVKHGDDKKHSQGFNQRDRKNVFIRLTMGQPRHSQYSDDCAVVR